MSNPTKAIVVGALAGIATVAAVFALAAIVAGLLPDVTAYGTVTL